MPHYSREIEEKRDAFERLCEKKHLWCDFTLIVTSGKYLDPVIQAEWQYFLDFGVLLPKGA